MEWIFVGVLGLVFFYLIGVRVGLWGCDHIWVLTRFYNHPDQSWWIENKCHKCKKIKIKKDYWWNQGGRR